LDVQLLEVPSQVETASAAKVRADGTARKIEEQTLTTNRIAIRDAMINARGNRLSNEKLSAVIFGPVDGICILDNLSLGEPCQGVAREGFDC
jgi:hypothetical protein